MQKIVQLREKFAKKPVDDSERVAQQQQEEAHRQQRDAEFAALTAADVDRVFSAAYDLPGPFATTGLSLQQTRDILLGSVAASEAYAYNACPFGNIFLYPQPYARLLRVIKSTQQFSLLEAPGKLLFVAIAGTHDMRTAIIDLKTTRTKVASGKHPISGKVFEYKLHAGFAAEAAALVKLLPTSALAEYVAMGYRIVCTGHSLGGALATLTLLRLLDDDPMTFEPCTTCVTFGAPLVGNSRLVAKVVKLRWANKVINLVNRSDIVPRVLTGRGLTKQIAIGVRDRVTGALSRGVGAAKGLLSKIGSGSKADAAGAAAGAGSRGLGDEAGGDDILSFDRAPEDQAEAEEQLAALEVDQLAVEASFVAPAAEEARVSDGDDENPSAPRRPFDSFGCYIFMFRDVPLKSTTDPTEAYTILRGGDGLKTVPADHSMINYFASIEELIAKK